MTGESKVAAPFRFEFDLRSGVPLYRQIIDQVLVAVASGVYVGGDQLPTVRQLAVDLSINPNTVVRAYKELEIRGFLETQQGSGTLLNNQKVKEDEVQRRERLDRIVSEFVARAAADGYTLSEILERLRDMQSEAGPVKAK